MEDILLTITFTLFVASTVNERIIDLLKLYLPKLGIRYYNPRDEIQRHRRLWLITFVTGLVTSFILSLNIVSLVLNLRNTLEGKDNLNKIASFFLGLGDLLAEAAKDGNENLSIVVYGIGFIFTAVFVSLGSKFWHDILDLVLFVKNSKRKIAQFSPKGVNKSEQIEAYMEENEFEIAKQALAAHTKDLQDRFPNASIQVQYEHYRKELRPCICIFHRGNKRGVKSTQPITYLAPSGNQYSFPIVEFEAGEVSINDSTSAEGGGALRNVNTPENSGTFGCIVKRIDEQCEDLYLLTCYHCLRVKGVHPWENLPANTEHTTIEFYNPYTTPHRIGKLTYGYRKQNMDIALVKADANVGITDYRRYDNVTVPTGLRAVTIEDARNRTKVWFSGMKTDNTSAYIINRKVKEDIRYDLNEPLYSIENLIVFSATQTKPYKKPCNFGDSGAIIMDSVTYEALGMIIASDDQFGYAIPITDILQVNRLALFTAPCQFVDTKNNPVQ